MSAQIVPTIRAVLVAPAKQGSPGPRSPGLITLDHAPGPSDGIDGEYAVYPTDAGKRLYGPKAAGAWPSDYLTFATSADIAAALAQAVATGTAVATVAANQAANANQAAQAARQQTAADAASAAASAASTEGALLTIATAVTTQGVTILNFITQGQD